MNVRFGILIALSCLAHTALLLWSPAPRPLVPQLNIGGEARSLQVALLPPAPLSKPDEPDRMPAPPSAPPARAAAASPPVEPLAARTKATPATPIRRAPPQTSNREPRQVSAAPPAVPSSLNVGERVSAALKNQLAENFEYPWLARKRGWQGLVTLSVHIDGNGAISEWKIARTSGFSVLDRSALKAASRIGHLPQAAELLGGQSIDLAIPVQYQLLDG
jgi:protein TonB